MLRPTPRTDDTIQLSDGRTLAYAEWGDPSGPPVFLLHGSPDSRLFCPDTYPTTRKSTDVGARVVTVDRPGYGRSDPRPGLTHLNWTDDFRELVDHLGLDQFAVSGLSGGGLYAIAVAVAMPERVDALGLVSTFGPLDDFPEGATDHSPEKAQLIESLRRDPFSVVEAFSEREKWIVETPEAMVNASDWPAAEQWLFENPAIPPLFLLELQEATRQGVVGYVWDRIANWSVTGFATRDISVPTHIWHGDRDEIVPFVNFQFLARTIPNASATVWPDEGHTALLHGDYWGEVLDALVGAPVSASSGIPKAGAHRQQTCRPR